MTEQIDKAKLLEWLEENNDPYFSREGIIYQIESGTLDIEPVSNTDELNRYKTALRKIVCLNIVMPDEVFNLANDALENLGGAKC